MLYQIERRTNRSRCCNSTSVARIVTKRLVKKYPFRFILLGYFCRYISLWFFFIFIFFRASSDTFVDNNFFLEHSFIGYSLIRSPHSASTLTPLPFSLLSFNPIAQPKVHKHFWEGALVHHRKNVHKNAIFKSMGFLSSSFYRSVKRNKIK